MNIIHFIHHFPNEESFDIFLKDYRKKAAIFCKTCKAFLNNYWFWTEISLNAAFAEGEAS
jgi:hypothetical protein